ncbi:transposase family protein [Streptomyces sp. NPDC127117]|uniref:transposase family protein n=1 Tax=Streptomyces sp. NPDC127117 TaxID=3345368 RepID=UPI00362500EE
MSHRVFCGLSRRHPGELAAGLAPRRVAPAASPGDVRANVGGRRAGPKYEPVFSDRLLVALAHLRTGLTHEALGVLHEVGSSTIGRAPREVPPRGRRPGRRALVSDRAAERPTRHNPNTELMHVRTTAC